MSPNYKASVFMLSSTLSLSVNGLAAKFLAGELSVEWLSFLRFFFPAILVFLILSFSKISIPDKANWTSLFIRGFSIAACQVCFLVGLESLTLVESVVLFATGPLFIPILERLFFGVTIRLVTKIGLFVTFFGVLMLAGGVKEIALRSELLWGLSAGLFNAGSQVSLFRSAKTSLSPLEINGWGFMLASLFVLPLLLLKGIYEHDIQFLLRPLDYQDVWLGLMVLSLLIINTQFFRAKAYKLASNNTQLAPLIFTNLIFTALWQKLFFAETFSQTQLLGILLIVGASMLQVFSLNDKKLHIDALKHRKL